MAKITQDIENPNAPSYLGYSQGTDRAKADTSTGELLQNVGSMIPGLAKTAYNVQKDLLQEDIQNRVDAIRGDAGLDDALNTPEGVAPTDVQGEANIFGDTSNVKAGRGSPAGVARFGQRVGNLQDKYQRGELSESYYNLRLFRMTQEVKAQHSGWGEEIDSIIQRTTGINPANALVKSLRSDMDAAERARAAGNSKLETEIHTDLQHATPDIAQRLIAGDRSPETIATFRGQVYSRKASEANIALQTHNLALKKAQGEYTDAEGVKVAQVATDDYMNNQFRKMYSAAGGADGIYQKIQAHGDKPWTPEEKQAVTDQYNQFKLNAINGLDQILSGDAFSPLDRSKKDAIRAAAVKRIDDMGQALFDNNHGALTGDARYVKAIEDHDTLALFNSNQIYRKLSAVSKNTGSAAAIVVGQMITDPKGPGAQQLNNATNVLIRADLGGMSTGEDTLKGAAERQKTFGKTNTQFNDPAAHKIRVDAAVAGLTQAKDVTEAENFAKGMFSKENVGFLELYKPAGQQRMFRTLTGPGVDLKMQEIGKTNPEIYQNYRDWVVSYGFQSQAKRSIDTVNEIHTDPSSFAQITVRDVNGVPQYVVEPRPGTEKTIALRGGPDPLGPAKQAVQDLNENIRIIAPILKREGGDVSQEVGKVLQNNGWDPNAPKKPTFVQSLGNALFGPGKTEGELNAPGTTQPTQGFDFKLDSLPKGKGIRPEEGSGSRSDLIDLDPAGLDAISAKSAGIKKVILQAESSGDYNSVFGTSRKIPLTKMTLDEVDQLQGQMKRSGSPSTAVGGFQFIRPTLQALKNQLGLRGDEIFDQSLQNRLADALLQARGFGKFMNGEMGHKSFVNSLAKEWAGLPTTEGKSHYEGDGLNHSTVKLRQVLDALKEFRDTGPGNPTNPTG